MQTAFHSPFLQALGYAIANSLWQMALIWILFSFINMILKPVAANKFRLGIFSQLIGFIWFLVTFQFYFNKCSDAYISNSSLSYSSNISIVFPVNDHSVSSFILNVLIKAEQLLPFLSFAYLLLLAILLIRWTNQYYRTQIIRNKGLQQIDDHWKLFVENIAEQLHIYNKIEIYVSELITSPLTIGFIKPIILVPVASINHLSVPQLEAVLLHEIAHIKRYDYLLNIIISVVETTLFFNPFIQLISKHIKRERENSCDDWVLQFKYNPSMYAEALLQIAYLSNNQTSTVSVLSMNATTKQNSDLLSRVKRIIGINDNGFKYRYQLLSLLLITCILSSIAWFHSYSFARNHATDAGKKTESIVVEPMTTRIDNPLFNPVFFLNKPLQKEVEKNVKVVVKKIRSSEKAAKESLEMLNSITPNAINDFNNFDLNDDGNNESIINLKIQNANELNSLNSKIDSVGRINKMIQVFKNNFSFPFKKMNIEPGKSKKELERSAINNQMFVFSDNKMWRDELNNVFDEIDQQEFYFPANTINPKIKKEINIVFRRMDSLRTNKARSTHGKTEKRMEEDTILDETIPLTFSQSGETKHQVQKSIVIKKTYSSIKHDPKLNDKHFEFVFSSKEEQNDYPYKIMIELKNK